eukprot:251968_1
MAALCWCRKGNAEFCPFAPIRTPYNIQATSYFPSSPPAFQPWTPALQQQYFDQNYLRPVYQNGQQYPHGQGYQGVCTSDPNQSGVTNNTNSESTSVHHPTQLASEQFGVYQSVQLSSDATHNQWEDQTEVLPEYEDANLEENIEPVFELSEEAKTMFMNSAIRRRIRKEQEKEKEREEFLESQGPLPFERDRQERAEATQLYGDRAEIILATEGALDIQFDRLVAKHAPPEFPACPLRF